MFEKLITKQSKLEHIGFYSLYDDDRAKTVSIHSNLIRCELIITNECNFNCIYCRDKRNKIFTSSYNEIYFIFYNVKSRGLKCLKI